MSEAASLSSDQNKANDFALTSIDSLSDKRVISMPSFLELSVTETTNFKRKSVLCSKYKAHIFVKKI